MLKKTCVTLSPPITAPKKVVAPEKMHKMNQCRKNGYAIVGLLLTVN